MPRCNLVIDAGTTAIKVAVLDESGAILWADKRYNEVTRAGELVEQDAELIWQTTRRLCEEAANRFGSDIAAIGIVNQRESVVAWDPETGLPLGPSLVWQDRRTAAACDAVGTEDKEYIRAATGLACSPYFSASKMAYLSARHGAGARLGTVDSWLLFKLTGGASFATDMTNASRTMLMDLKNGEWDERLLALWGIPRAALPRVMPTAADYGVASVGGFSIPVRALCGDQQADLPLMPREAGATKVTCGTGTFVLQLSRDMTLADGWYATRTPFADDWHYALEMPLPFYGTEIDAVLGDAARLDAVLERHADGIAAAVRALPTPATSLLLDGGSARDGLLLAKLRERLAIPVSMPAHFDGTVLGINELLSQ